MFFEVFLLGQLVWDLPLLVFLAGIVFIYSYLLNHITTLKQYKKQPLLFFPFHMVHYSFAYLIK